MSYYNWGSRRPGYPYSDVYGGWPTHYDMAAPTAQSAAYHIVYPDNPAIQPTSASVSLDISSPLAVTGIDSLGWVNLLPGIPPVHNAGAIHIDLAVQPSANDPAYLLAPANATDVAPVAATASQTTMVAQPTTSTSQSARQTCPHCGSIHRRKARYEACHNKHIDLRPFVCAGKCGKRSCTRTFAGSEQKISHIRGRVTCEKCGKPGWKQNKSRHRTSCNPGGID